MTRRCPALPGPHVGACLFSWGGENSACGRVRKQALLWGYWRCLGLLESHQALQHAWLDEKDLL